MGDLYASADIQNSWSGQDAAPGSAAHQESQQLLAQSVPLFQQMASYFLSLTPAVASLRPPATTTQSGTQTQGVPHMQQMPFPFMFPQPQPGQTNAQQFPFPFPGFPQQQQTQNSGQPTSQQAPPAGAAGAPFAQLMSQLMPAVAPLAQQIAQQVAAAEDSNQARMS
jgi:hypothetical protein